MQKLIHILLIVLFFSLPLIHGQLLNNFGINFGFSVDGNFEFTKSQFFIFLSGIIFLLFGLQSFNHKKNIIIPKLVFILIPLLGISTLFSQSQYISFFGLNTKGHGTLMFFCLIGIYIVLIQQDKNLMKKLFYASIFGAFITSLLAIKEYYIPSFDYGDLSNRALGTFGHPSYLVAYLLLLIPFFIKKVRKQKLLYSILIPIIFTIFLTKSAWGIFIFLSYIVFLIFQNKKIKKYQLLISIFIVGIIISYFIYQFGLYTKLHSFLSRFYIWETTLRIIIDTPRILLFGSGFDTLINYFESYKSPELYIFENFGFTADRPHNLFLNILFHLGIGGVFIFGYSLFLIIKKYKNNYLYHSLLIILLFTVFNFLSIASYLLIVLILSCISIQKEKNSSPLFSVIFLLFSIITMYFSFAFYSSEIQTSSGNYEKAINIFPYNYKNYEYMQDSENILKYAGYMTKNFYRGQLEVTNTSSVCNKFTINYPSTETYFFCGDYAWNIGNKQLAREYYMQGLNKLPDLWNTDSYYHGNFFIKNSIDGIRFFSPKYSNLKEVLERVGVENNLK